MKNTIRSGWKGRSVLGLLTPLLMLIAASCREENAEGGEPGVDVAWNPGAVTEVSGVPVAQVKTAIEQHLAAEAPAPIDEEQWGHAKAIYTRFGGAPLWFGADGLAGDRAAALISALMNAHQDALRLDRYPLNELSRALVAVADEDAPTAEQVGRADVLMTAAYAALGEDLLTGQVDPETASTDWHIDVKEEEVDSALVASLRSDQLDATIARMRPQDEDYLALQRELQRYRDIASKGDWPRVPEGEALKPGDSGSQARLGALRQRLRAEGLLADSGATSTTTAYDAALAGAVAEFQTRHGIVSDSVLGAETVASLNTPPGFRLGQIAANLERHRWFPRQLGARFILVNVPAFRLEAYDAGKKALEMKVIVGEEYEDRRTPVFSDSMEYVVFRPYWLVTPDIAEKELFPEIASNPGLLSSGNYEIYQAEGERRIRQKPGPKNSLGLVKFMFPNDFNIYLHDTPNDQLFQEDVRAFSHGCIRLEKPDQLAQFVLGWDASRVQAEMNGSDDHRVNLPRKIPVYIAYFTTYMRNGRLHFGNDLYFRDDDLIRAVAGGAMPDAQAQQALNSLRRFVAE